VSAADPTSTKYHVWKVLTKHLTKLITKNRGQAFPAQMLEARALQGQRYLGKDSTREERKKVASLWYEAALTRDRMVALEWELLSKKEVCVRRDVAMAAYNIARALHWLEVDDIHLLRLGIEMICSDPLVAEILPSDKIRHNNLVRLLLCSALLAGKRCIVDISTLKSTIEGLWNSNEPDIRECLSGILEGLTEVSPETAKILRGFIEG